jgi:hypothetical protein
MTGTAEPLHTEPQPSTGDHPRQSRQPAHDLFVSYATHDKPVADAIVVRLEQAGIHCWVAPRDVLPGAVWGEAIVHAIEATRLMVVVMSGQANTSRHVPREIERAVAGNTVVVPFRIEAVEPTGAIWLRRTGPFCGHVGRGRSRDWLCRLRPLRWRVAGQHPV